MRLKIIIGVAAASVGALSATPASAVAFTLTGATTLSSPTFNRTLAGTPPTSLSAVGTAVHYNAITFSVGTTGSYSFLLNSGTGGFDTFLALYSPSFNPSTPLANVLVANDDFGTGPTSLTQSGFTRALTAGTSYIAVVTGFSNTDVGAYSFTIDGPLVAAIPEPATWALLIAGFGATGAAMRRRAAVRTRVRYA